MTRQDFWKIVDEARPGNDPHEQVEVIQKQLTSLSAEEIVEFERHISELLASSYTWKLWGAAYVMNGGCSDDGFDYFRGWLISRGQSVFEKALDEPDSLADLPDVGLDVDCEEMLSAAYCAYQSVTGQEIPMVQINLPDLGESWDFDDQFEMKKRYPKLVAKYEWL